MSASPDLAPPGSSSYHSDSMTVGDGTWDTSRNTFLLPNLVGLNFKTMRYNGMGNRFQQLPNYHGLIEAHGIIAAITFLLIVPTAIMTLRFNYRSRRWAVRTHVWLQILTVLLTTVIFVLGWFAVGPSRKLTNPHHGVGLAIYVLVLFQFIFGWWMSGRERKSKRMYEPLKVMLHHWLGRAIALLGIAQVALGLTLYGSPVALFVLYALAVFALLVVYFILTHLDERDYMGGDHDSRYSYGDGSVADSRYSPRRRSGSGRLLKGALAGAGIYALVDRIRSRRSRREDAPEVVASRRHSGSYLEDEKYSQYGRDPDRRVRWEDRLLRVAAPIGAAGVAGRFLDRMHRDRDSDDGDYGPPLGGATPINQGATAGPTPLVGPPPPGAPGPYGRPTGAPPPSGQHPLNRPPSSMTYSDYLSAADEPRRGHGLRNGIATLGVLGFAKSMWNRRRDRKEDERIEQEHEARMSGGHLTGDGRPLRHHRRNTSSIGSDSSLAANTHPQTAHGIPPLPAGTFAPGSAGAAAVERERQERERRAQQALPLGGVPRPVSMPPMPPDPQGVLHREGSSRSESVVSASVESHDHHRPARDSAAATIGAGAAGLAAGEALSHSHQRDHSTSGRGSLPPPPSNRTSSNNQGTASTPVSVKVRMHDNGRKVTLRRLPEDEARAEREARRAARQARRRGAGAGAASDSFSSLSGSDVGGRPGHRFRRRDTREQQQNAEAMRLESERLAEARQRAQNQPQSSPLQAPGHLSSPAALPSPSDYPPPPPIVPDTSPRPPGAGAGAGGGSGAGGGYLSATGGGGSGVGSPGTYDGGTSGGSDYAAQRRRRRAERAQSSAAKKTVGFE